MTPQGEIAPGLFTLIERMRELSKKLNLPFNAVLVAAGADVSHLNLMDNGEKYSVVCEAPEEAPTYDIWKREDGNSSPLEMGLTMDEAARFMIAAYTGAKLQRIAKRIKEEVAKN